MVLTSDVLYAFAHAVRRIDSINQSAFTLIELLVALALFAIAAGMATLVYPVILANWRLDAAARQVRFDLQRVRLQAIAEGVSHRLRFSLQAGTYRFQRREKQTYADDAPAASLPPGVIVAACSAASSSITFHPRGHAGTFGTITLQGTTGRQRRVIVDMVGRTRIQ
jgi:prepilin-type N-terminal cleavage/methylation domain-containing protein